MNTKLQELKEIVKRQANDLRELRHETKEMQRSGKYAGRLQCKLLYLKDEARHHLIAYAELLGKSRDRIENPRKDNLPNEAVISRIKDKYSLKIEETAE